eukprot:SAG11_NODE_8458_length_1013_cov_0.982495_2_plen_70_part_01
MLAAAALDWRALQFASVELRTDGAVVLQVVAQHGSALQFASMELRASRKFMLAAVEVADGHALQHASAAL